MQCAHSAGPHHPGPGAASRQQQSGPAPRTPSTSTSQADAAKVSTKQPSPGSYSYSPPVTAPATMPAKDQGFTEDQIEDFKEVFQLFDTKGDGLIQVDMRI